MSRSITSWIILIFCRWSKPSAAARPAPGLCGETLFKDLVDQKLDRIDIGLAAARLAEISDLFDRVEVVFTDDPEDFVVESPKHVQTMVSLQMHHSGFAGAVVVDGGLESFRPMTEQCIFWLGRPPGYSASCW